MTHIEGCRITYILAILSRDILEKNLKPFTKYDTMTIPVRSSP